MNSSAPLNNDFREMLPLSPAAFFVLFALADGEKHGYLNHAGGKSFVGRQTPNGTRDPLHNDPKTCGPVVH